MNTGLTYSHLVIVVSFFSIYESLCETTSNDVDLGYQYCDRKAEGEDACQKPENIVTPPHLTRIHPNKNPGTRYVTVANIKEREEIVLKTWEVGEEVEIEFDGRLLKRITRAIQPPIFEIPEYLTDSECETVISRAKERGLKRSTTMASSYSKQSNLTSMMNLSDVYRVSEHATLLWNDSITTTLRERAIHLTGLSRNILFGSEPLQVVHYTPGGHYHAHLDSQSSDIKKPCCHSTPLRANVSWASSCRTCRYATLLHYLNDVEEGGETVFPWAQFEDNIPDDKGDEHKLNLNTNCHSSNIVIQPKRGTLIMWYSHLMDEKGCIGSLDRRSVHGGCDVIKGEKWIVTAWVNAPVEKEGEPSNCP